MAEWLELVNWPTGLATTVSELAGSAGRECYHLAMFLNDPLPPTSTRSPGPDKAALTTG